MRRVAPKRTTRRTNLSEKICRGAVVLAVSRCFHRRGVCGERILPWLCVRSAAMTFTDYQAKKIMETQARHPASVEATTVQLRIARVALLPSPQ